METSKRHFLHSRSEGLISAEEFEKIKNSHVLIAGCGLGSLIAVAAARIGFGKFTLADGDIVEETNLNRQDYSHSDVGKLKVDALRERLLQINPEVAVTTMPVFIDESNIDEAITGVDIVLDAIDPIQSPIAVMGLHKAAVKSNKPVVFPIDIGWGGGVYVFTKESKSVEEMLGGEFRDITEEEIRDRFFAYYAGIIPEYFQGVMEGVTNGRVGNIPQPVSGAFVTSAIAVVSMKRLVLGLPVKLAPKFLSFDPTLAHSP